MSESIYKKVDEFVIPMKELNGERQFSFICKIIDVAMQKQISTQTRLFPTINKEKSDINNLVIDIREIS